MIELSFSELAGLVYWFPPERPGYLVGPHIQNTGFGQAWADRFPNPRALLAEVAGNYQLYGDAAAITPDELTSRLRGFIDCPQEFEPLLRAACPDLVSWKRIVYRLEDLPTLSTLPGVEIRRLVDEDASILASLSPDSAWVIKTLGGPNKAARSGLAWGAIINGVLASIACPFFIGFHYEDIGVATEVPYRGRGLSTACTYALSNDVLQRGKQVSWNTSPDNRVSIRVAEKVGFRFTRFDRLLVTDVEIPKE
jgi:RimJ/RimL family protein N-acetyltransferase